ncbi:MAG: aminotransferase class I/II-fold pyridoxal phosphate-dependent enzyme [Candidatus Sericytochromatia bacterium]
MIIEQAKRLDNVSEYYFVSKLAQIKKMQDEGLDVINLGIGSPDMPPSEETVNALINSAKNPKNHSYQAYKGIPDFRKAIAEWTKKTYQVELNPETELLPLIGSKEGILHISMAFLNNGDEVLIADPSYPTYSSVTNLAGGIIKKYNLTENNNWQPNIEELKAMDLSKVKIMWLNYPNMPTGAKADKKVFEELINLALEKKFLLCHDNPYSLVLNTDKPTSILSLPNAKEVCLELNSLSKSHNMAGWRIGWISGKKEYIDTILKFKSNIDSGMFLPVQHAAIEALKNSEEWHDKRNEEYNKRKFYAKEILNALNCKYSENQEGMFFWAKIPDALNSGEELIEDILAKKHVFITPGFIFGNNGKRYIRISLCASVDRLKDASERIIV